MTVQLPPVQASLSASTELTAIVGDRIGQQLVPQDISRPYVAWFIATAVPENQLASTPEDDDQRVQVDCYSKDQTQCRQIMQAAADTMEAIGHIVFGPWSEFESDTELYRWSFDVEIWNPR